MLTGAATKYGPGRRTAWSCANPCVRPALRRSCMSPMTWVSRTIHRFFSMMTLRPAIRDPDGTTFFIGPTSLLRRFQNTSGQGLSDKGKGFPGPRRPVPKVAARPTPRGDPYSAGQRAVNSRRQPTRSLGWERRRRPCCHTSAAYWLAQPLRLRQGPIVRKSKFL